MFNMPDLVHLGPMLHRRALIAAVTQQDHASQRPSQRPPQPPETRRPSTGEEARVFHYIRLLRALVHGALGRSQSRDSNVGARPGVRSRTNSSGSPSVFSRWAPNESMQRGVPLVYSQSRRRWRNDATVVKHAVVSWRRRVCWFWVAVAGCWCGGLQSSILR